MPTDNTIPRGLLVNIDVPDLAAGMEFYTVALGLAPGRQLGDGVAELQLADGARVCLVEREAGSAATPAGNPRSFTRHWTPVHVDFVVDDLPGARARALAAGATAEGEPGHWRGSTWASFADPFGNGFCLISFDADGYS